MAVHNSTVVVRIGYYVQKDVAEGTISDHGLMEVFSEGIVDPLRKDSLFARYEPLFAEVRVTTIVRVSADEVLRSKLATSLLQQSQSDR